VVEDSLTYRTKEQVLYDLSKALCFSPDSLLANRAGKVSSEQIKLLLPQFLRPAILTAIFAAAPFLVWTWIKSSSDQLPFDAAFPVLLKELVHVHDLFENHGRMGALIMLGSILVSLAVAVLMASRVPVMLYLDLLDGKVEVNEGRVVAREEQVLRPNGRDPIEKYFFTLRYLKIPVNLAAYRALEAGSMYLVYLLPRSETLVSIEPKVESSEPKVEFSASKQQNESAVAASSKAPQDGPDLSPSH
jgi:hypothetical protein